MGRLGDAVWASPFRQKDPYPVDALPTCNHALSVCSQERKCIKLFEDFKLNCKVRDNKCRMEDRNLCHESWANLRKSPMFGCICPNNNMKRRCDRIFSVVNHNPCVDYFLLFSGPDVKNSFQTDSVLSKQLTIHFPSFILPPPAHPTHGNSQVYDTNRTQRTGTVTSTGTDFHAPLEETLITSLQFPEFVGPAQDNTSAASFDYGIVNSVVENPLVDAVNGLEAHSNTEHINVSVLNSKGKQINFSNISFDEDLDNKLDFQNGHRKHSSPSDHSRSEMNEIGKTIFQSTCHLAMESCNNNYNCKMAMAPILHHCDLSRCNRNSCMEALQAFYRKPSFPWNLEIAFCLCKKTDNKQDSCMMAQQRLHPVCAQRIEGSSQPTCLSVAEVCREDKECRSRLEYYEQSCAVDSVTKKCAGPPSECRTAMLGILGTELRTTCACKGTDMTQLYECLGWQRLLWVNPCVVESQKDFHRKKAVDKVLLKTTTTSSTTTTTKRTPYNIMEYPIEQITILSYTQASVQTRDSTVAEYAVSSITPTKTTTTTTTLMGTTTLPPKYCIFQRHDFPDQYIKEGTLKRIYHEDESDCSEICKCGKPEELICKTMCVDRMPCKSEFAFYNHAAPAFQAYRGRCLCYSGRFICMKPVPGDYNLPQGIFLFLGYSEADEQQLKNHTEIVVQDVVHALQEFILREAVNGTFCALQLFNITSENVIIAGKLSSEEVDYNMLSPKESLAKEKTEQPCTLTVDNETIDESRVIAETRNEARTPQSTRPRSLQCEVKEAGKHVKEALTLFQQSFAKRESQASQDDSDIYALGLAKKLRSFSEEERLEIMYEIDGMIINRRRAKQPNRFTTNAFIPSPQYSQCSSPMSSYSEPLPRQVLYRHNTQIHVPNEHHTRQMYSDSDSSEIHLSQNADAEAG
ncbi:hypothetical protein FQR65_LT00739 [Abscondita terminalis]|nr:hypothetical protein FQR65_LT00739 [Abscondita terminalis]